MARVRAPRRRQKANSAGMTPVLPPVVQPGDAVTDRQVRGDAGTGLVETVPTWQPYFGAQVVAGRGVFFRVWAPQSETVDVLLYGRRTPRALRLEPEAEGVFSGLAPGIGAGTRYKFRLNGGDAFPDPCSRFQPEGVHGPSEVIDPTRFRWHDAAWPGLDARRLVVYEVHVGAATAQGTFAGLIPHLRELRRLGVTALELMPIAAFPGRWNWGYDGVGLYAPAEVYGGPAGLRRLVDAAHEAGLGVLLDVVYNHLGPDGNYLRAFAGEYFTNRHHTPWGDALNYDGPDAKWVRKYVIDNACYWLQEYHLDGLRLDAVHAISDRSPRHLLAEISSEARAVVGRPVLITAESADNDIRLIDSTDRGGYGLDAVWADDFHHALRVYLTGEREGYYQDYGGRLAEVARTLRHGFLYQGEPSKQLGRPRGTRVTSQPAERFIFCIQNHDQIGNRAFGERLHHQIDPQRYAVASTLLLTAPETPLLFMGQDFAASSPFLYFTDHHRELGRLVTAGRREEFKQFAAFRDAALRHTIPDPQDELTFLRSKLDWAERRSNSGIHRLYRDLLRLRRSDPVLQAPDRERLVAIALTDDVLVHWRWTAEESRLVVANFGSALAVDLTHIPELFHLPPGPWRVILATSARRYGGSGRRPSLQTGASGSSIRLPERSAAVFAGSSPTTHPAG